MNNLNINIDDNLFKKDDLFYRKTVYKLVSDINEANKKIDNLNGIINKQQNEINKLNEQIIELKNYFSEIIKIHDDEIEKVKEEIGKINRSNYIESYKSLRRGVPLPYIPILSKDPSFGFKNDV